MKRLNKSFVANLQKLKILKIYNIYALRNTSTKQID